MTPPKKCIAIKSGALLALLLASPLALAEPAGVVSDSTGPLLARSASGSIKVLAVGSRVEPLDTLISRPGVYARVTLTDHSDLALGPDTELVIENYSFKDQGSRAAYRRVAYESAPALSARATQTRSLSRRERPRSIFITVSSSRRTSTEPRANWHDVMSTRPGRPMARLL